MAEEMRKRSSFTRRHRSALSDSTSPTMEGGAPVEESRGSACGHSSCGHTCNVRYVGAVSHIRDHHAMHAARGVSHIWAASIVTGFAIVLTGVIAFNSVDAETRAAARAPAQTDLSRIMQRLDNLEKIVSETRDACQGTDAGLNGDIPTDPSTDPTLGNQGAMLQDKKLPPVAVRNVQNAGQPVAAPENGAN